MKMSASVRGPDCECRYVPTDFGKVDGDGWFEGYASLFNRPDLGGDVVVPGAFANSLRRRGAAGVRMLFQHDPAQPVGIWRQIREDGRGLFVRGRLLTGVARSRELLELMRAGGLDGLSIGFRTVRASPADRAGRTGRSGRGRNRGRRLLEIDLWEISIVTFPMQQGARISAVRGARAMTRSGHMRPVGGGGAAGVGNERLPAMLRRAARMMNERKSSDERI